MEACWLADNTKAAWSHRVNRTTLCSGDLREHGGTTTRVKLQCDRDWADEITVRLQRSWFKFEGSVNVPTTGPSGY